MRRAGVVVAVVALFVVGCGTTQPSDPGGTAVTPSQVAVASPSRSPLATSAATPTPAPTPTPSRSAPPEPTPILDGSIVPIDGWTALGSLSGDGADASQGVGTLSGSMPGGWSSVMVSVACAGTGTIHVESGDESRDVECPVATSAPERMTFYAETPTYQVKASRVGQVAYEVRVDGAESVLARPPVLITGAGRAARMTEGCGIYLHLSWGFEAVDDCATSLPGDPIPTVSARNGRVDVRIPGWTISDAALRCGRIGPNDIPEFIELRGCHPNAHVDGSTVAISGLPSTGGRRLLELRFTARNAAGDEFRVPYYAYARP